MKNNTGVVIVTYYPEINKVNRLCQMLTEAGVKPTLVDNGTLSSEYVEELSVYANVIRLDNNYGIAHAQNIGIEFNISESKDYILFFDQDSEIASDYVSSIIRDIEFLEEKGENVATLGPVFRDSRYNFYYELIRLNKLGFRKKIKPENINGIIEVSMIISSGSIVPTRVLKDIGTMNEDFFIDYVDTEWCLRAISKGYKIFCTKNALMEHAIGDSFIKLSCFNIPVHSAFRRYYRIRNCLYFFKMNHIPLVLKCRDFLFNIIHQSIIIIKVKNKKEYISSLYKGLKDGVHYLCKTDIGK